MDRLASPSTRVSPQASRRRGRKRPIKRDYSARYQGTFRDTRLAPMIYLGSRPEGARRNDRRVRLMPDFDFSEYQRLAARTGGPVDANHPIAYPTLGLTNEAGEVAGKVKKIFRDGGGVVTDADRAALARELGDVLWYIAELCTQLGISLEDVAGENIRKLTDRTVRGVLRGEGDDR